VAGERIVAQLRRRLYAHVLSQEIAFFDGRRTGELMSRLASDTTVMQTTGHDQRQHGAAQRGG